MHNRCPISVIMPAYNHEKYVGAAIESVLEQSFMEFELIIINDGSTDRTDAIIREYNDPRIRYFVQKNADAFNVINRGISLAKGNYVSIINSDDLYHHERLECLLREAMSNEATFLFTGITVVDEHSRPIIDPAHKFISWYDRLRRHYSQNKSMEQSFFKGNLAVSTSNFFFSVDLINKIGLFRQYRYAHDYDFALRALAECSHNFRFIPDDSLLCYRIHEGNTINESSSASYLEYIKILVENFPLFLHDESDRSTFSNLRESAISPLLERSDFLESVQRSISWKVTRPLHSLCNILSEKK